MPREFDSYEDAKEYYDRMVNDRVVYGALNAEYNRIENVLKNTQAIPGDKLRDGLKEEMEVCREARDSLKAKFPERYGVQNINQLSIKIQEFGPEMERLKAQSPSYETKAPEDIYVGNVQARRQGYNSGSGSGEAQPPANERNEPTHHDRTPSPRSQGAADYSGEREKAPDTPSKAALEAVREEYTPFADNLAAIRGQPVPARNLPEHLINEPEQQVDRYETDDYDKLYAPTALKDTIEAVKEREEDRSR